MALALTNEERFIVSCNTMGEADVRQKLGAGRFSERRAEWASNWLEQLESGKSDATKAEEKSKRSLTYANPKRLSFGVVLAVVLVLTIAGAVATALI